MDCYCMDCCCKDCSTFPLNFVDKEDKVASSFSFRKAKKNLDLAFIRMDSKGSYCKEMVLNFKSSCCWDKVLNFKCSCCLDKVLDFVDSVHKDCFN